MNKESIKTLCEANPQLQWWSMVLYAEISELVEYCRRRVENMDAAAIQVIISKVDEFPRLVVQEALNAAKGKPSYDKRLGVIEAKVGIQR